jgi:hypothetical protein
MRFHRLFRLLISLVAVLALLIVSSAWFAAPALAAPPPSSSSSSVVTYSPSSNGAAPAVINIWPCTVQVFAGKLGSTTLWAQSFTSCNGQFESTQVTISAWHCNVSVAGACIGGWDYQGTMTNGSCFVTWETQLWCPSSGVATRGVGSGELWRAQALSCTVDPSGDGACGTATQQVQF